MKKSIILLALCILSFVSFSQAKDTTGSKTDTAQKKYFVLIGTEQDYKFLLQALRNPDGITIGQMKDIIQWVNNAKLIQTAPTNLSKEAQKPKKQKP